MSETLATIVVVATGIMVLCVASVIIALKTRNDRSVTWRGFGVVFRIKPCMRCKLRAASRQRE